jgi:hypothetical protein
MHSTRNLRLFVGANAWTSTLLQEVEDYGRVVTCDVAYIYVIVVRVVTGCDAIWE